MKTESEIYEDLLPLLQEALGVRQEEIRFESVLMSDLGAESIDLLDLSFQIEDKFKVTIEANELEREARNRLPDMVFEADGLLTDEALAEIGASMPELDRAKLVKGLRKSEIPSLLTVGFFVRVIARKLEAKNQGVSCA
jgi:acyl carrier protein